MTSNRALASAPQVADVIIIGGGPVGLSLALHLDHLGVGSVLIESEAVTRWHPKGNTNNARTMELFRHLGIADKVRALGLPDDHPFDIGFFTRLSKFEIARGRTLSRRERMKQRSLSEPTDQIPEPPHRANQMYVERFLFEHAQQCRFIDLRFAYRAERFVQDEDGVTVTLSSRETRETIDIRSAYLVGCDGSRGLVRNALNIRYGGEETLMDVFMAGEFTAVHLRIPQLYPLFLGSRRAWMYAVINPDLRAQIIALNGTDEFMMHIPTKSGDVVDEASIIARVKNAIGVDIKVEVLSHRRWNAGTYLVAEKYRDGRVFIAGDAAHLYAPTGGFGMNTGVDDTSNLSWKLAAVLQGWGGGFLLDSYEAERRPVALRNASAARALGKARHDVKVTEVVEHDTPEGEAERLRVANSDFVTKSHFTLPEERDSLGVILGARYDDSPIVVADGTPPPDSWERYFPSDVPGGRAPHLWLDEARAPGSSLYDHLGTGFTLLRIGAAPPPSDALEVEAAHMRIPLKVLDLPQPYASRLYSHRLYLVRPDHYIAWRGNALPDDPVALFLTVTGASAKPKIGQATLPTPAVVTGGEK